MVECAKNNEKFDDEILRELSLIQGGEEFAVNCQGKISYDELIKILSCCEDSVAYRISGQPFKTWRNGKDYPLIKDLAEYSGQGGFVDSVEMILYVPSIIETVRWYRKNLGWDGCDSIEDEEYGYSQIFAYDKNSSELMYKNFKGFHLRKAGYYETTKGSCFVFVSSINQLREQFIKNGCKSVSDIVDNSWGTIGFTVTDLNGFVLEFCEWSGCYED